MNRHLLYLIGIPGSGKSSIMRALLSQGHYTRWQQASEPCPHIIHQHPAEGLGSETGGGWPHILVELGVQRSSFPGTDGLRMDIMPEALKFLEVNPHPVVVAEGDRLSSVKFFKAARDNGYEVHIIWIDMPEEIAAARRELRGSHQHPSWVKGRVTKVHRLGQEAQLTLVPTERTSAEGLASLVGEYLLSHLKAPVTA